jgi:hypothetical protein
MDEQKESRETNPSTEPEKPPKPKFKLPPNRPDDIYTVVDRTVVKRKKPTDESSTPIV